MAKARRGKIPASKSQGNDIVGKDDDKEINVLVEQTLTWNAPIPPPEILRGYDSVIKDGAERLFHQFELEAEHRRSLQWRGQSHNLTVALSGRISALIFSLASLGVAVLALLRDYPWAAGAFGCGTIALVVAAFTGVPNLLRQRKLQAKQERDVA